MIGFILKPAEVIQKPALIGGPFTLIDHNGKIVKSSDYEGKILIVYFGYTFCPDVCPTDLQKISLGLDMLERNKLETSHFQPIFISIDPERDTVEVMNEYVENFHPSLIGLTGTTEQIKAAAKNYKVYYQKAANSEDDYYLMDHSSIIYVIGPDGKYLSHFTSLDSQKIIANRLSHYLDEKF